jgi:S-methylmethionine-dependent homocysteine/selenocysteine methylase
MGGELIRRGAASVGGLWSAQALLDDPEAVLNLHRDYIRAGARMITTNTYSTVPSYLGKSHLESRYVELTRLAGELARKAADESNVSVTVLGAIPPLSESYRPDLVPEPIDAAPVYKNVVIALRDYADVFLCETMSSGIEALTAVRAAFEYGNGTPVMVSWTLNEAPGKGLRSGESVAEAFAMLADIPVSGFLFNCTHPEAIVVALEELAPLTDQPIGAYPNRLNAVASDWTLDQEERTGMRTDLDVDLYLEMSAKFKAAGASIIGGCCGIGPEYIQALSASHLGEDAKG